MSSSSIDDDYKIITARPSVAQLVAAVKVGESTDDQADERNLQELQSLSRICWSLDEPKKVISLVQSPILSKVPSPKPPTASDRLGSLVEDESSNNFMSSSSIYDEYEIITARPSVAQLAAAVKVGESTTQILMFMVATWL